MRFIPSIIGTMIGLTEFASKIRERRKQLGITQSELASKAGIGRATIDALENGRVGEIGFSKLLRILSALNLEIKLREAHLRRPTLEELLEEDGNDKGLD